MRKLDKKVSLYPPSFSVHALTHTYNISLVSVFAFSMRKKIVSLKNALLDVKRGEREGACRNLPLLHGKSLPVILYNFLSDSSPPSSRHFRNGRRRKKHLGSGHCFTRQREKGKSDFFPTNDESACELGTGGSLISSRLLRECKKGGHEHVRSSFFPSLREMTD